jgi:hypothetical protein
MKNLKYHFDNYKFLKAVKIHNFESVSYFNEKSKKNYSMKVTYRGSRLN